MKQSDINITTEMIKEQVKKIPNWESPGPDRVHGYWLMKLTALYERIAKQMDNIISNREDIPKVRRLFVKKTLVKKMLLIITDQFCACL